MTRYDQVPIQWTLAPFSEPDTSRAAAKAITPHLPHLEQIVLTALRQHGPQTAQELEDRLRMDGSTVRPRLVTLRARGMVRDSGLRRRTRSLRAAKVWIAT